MTEQWKPAYGLEDRYEVSNLGQVRSINREFTIIDKRGVECLRRVKSTVITPYLDVDGYKEVSLSLGKGKTIAKRIGRLVLETFNPVEGMRELQCNHKDYNRQNDCIDNLEWTTGLENTRYSTDVHKPIPGPVRGVTDLTNNISYPSVRAAAMDITSKNADTTIRDAIAKQRIYKGRVLIFTDQITDDFDRDEYIEFVLANDKRRHSVGHRSVTELKSGKVYPTLASAVQASGGTESGLLNSIQGHVPYKDKVFVYTDQINKDFDKEKYIEDAYAQGVVPWKKVPVMDLTTGEVYESMNKASTLLGLPSEAVRLSISNKRDCSGHVFVTDFNLTDQQKEAYLEAVRTRCGCGISCEIKDLTTGEIFSSYNTAGESVGGSGAMVQNCVKAKKCYKGHIFARVMDIVEDFDEAEYIAACKENSKKHSRGVRCVETGKEYKSIAEVTRELNVTRDVFTCHRVDNVIAFRELHYEVGSY